MTKKIFAIGFGTIAILGAVLFAFVFIFQLDTTGMVISKTQINYFGTYTWEFYKLDIYRWLRSIETALNPTQLWNLIPSFPKTPTQPKDWTDFAGTMKYIAQILVVFIPNIVVFLINIMLWPIKILVYPIHILAAVLGVDTNDINIFKAFERMWKLVIPFIPYW